MQWQPQMCKCGQRNQCRFIFGRNFERNSGNDEDRLVALVSPWITLDLVNIIIHLSESTRSQQLLILVNEPKT